MTREEAIKILNFQRGYFCDLKGCEEQQAFTMAIKALEQEPCEDWYDVPSDEMTLGQARRAVKDLRKKLSEHLEQEPILDKIRAEIESAANKQFQIAMGVSDLNERYAHIQMENAYRHSLSVIDKYKASPTGAESEE